jgi:VanZ family protein
VRSDHLAPAVLAVVAATALVTSLVPVTSGGVPPEGPFGLAGADKWAHAAGYAVFAVAAAATLRRGTARTAFVAAAGAAAFGAGIELLQWPLTTRTASVLDALANAVGASAGTAAWFALRRPDRRTDGNEDRRRA